MRKHIRLTRVVVALLFVASAGACGESAPADDAITASVKAGLAADATVRSSQVDVFTSDRVVTLTGRVDTPSIKEQAVRIARQTSGVRDIVDNLQVQATTAPPPAAAAEPAASSGATAATGGTSPTVGEGATPTGRAPGAAATTDSRPVIDAAKTTGAVVGEAGKNTGVAVGEAGKVTGTAVGDAAVTTGKATAQGAEAVAGGAKRLGTGIAGAVTGGDKQDDKEEEKK
jgi:hypothetical protein